MMKICVHNGHGKTAGAIPCPTVRRLKCGSDIIGEADTEIIHYSIFIIQYSFFHIRPYWTKKKK
ncbi:MAG: hypothetical protein J6A16_01120 [Oscillospiraceae bacterium]|nr:hypothetical protein [Oscillospiraceae bacterium]